MSTICRDCEAIVVADDDVPADLVRIAMANHERFCKPGRREICDICDDVDFITSSGETNIHAVLSRLTGFRSPTPRALAQHLTRHNRHDLTARLPGLHAAKPIATPSTQREEPTMNLQSVPEARPPAASLVDHEDKRIAIRVTQKKDFRLDLAEKILPAEVITAATVIGPECFSDEEELVICWKGRNYYADPADEVNLIAEVEALRAQVARVREAVANGRDG
ncbi:MAG: hypothetical protein IPK64_20210 [bacterium]|nr:hypothetical protein [bacterium]